MNLQALVMEDIFELYELNHSDLLKMASEQKVQPSGEEVQRLESIRQAVVQNLGRGGPGLLSITGVSDALTLQQDLLPLARKLALLNRDDRKRVLKDHNLGSDVSLKNLNRRVSSFAMQMKYGEYHDSKSRDFSDGEFKYLGSKFQELGFLMMELGISLARVCDKYLEGCELEQTLLHCGSAKGRLIHYHSVADTAAIKAASLPNQQPDLDNRGENRSSHDSNSDLWQQWHYDYGIFTMLTSPIFLSSSIGEGKEDTRECESPDGHTYLQLYHPELKRALMVKASKGCFIVQVGEAADILSNGKLRATLHSVQRPLAAELSRETFVIFLQPSWSKILSVSNSAFGNEDSDCDPELDTRISKTVPPLSSRLRDGMTFAEFARETTKQYYGGGGLQPNRFQ